MAQVIMEASLLLSFLTLSGTDSSCSVKPPESDAPTIDGITANMGPEKNVEELSPSQVFFQKTRTVASDTDIFPRSPPPFVSPSARSVSFRALAGPRREDRPARLGPDIQPLRVAAAEPLAAIQRRGALSPRRSEKRSAVSVNSQLD